MSVSDAKKREKAGTGKTDALRGFAPHQAFRSTLPPLFATASAACFATGAGVGATLIFVAAPLVACFPTGAAAGIPLAFVDASNVFLSTTALTVDLETA
jgi:hypothetical protein